MTGTSSKKSSIKAWTLTFISWRAKDDQTKMFRKHKARANTHKKDYYYYSSTAHDITCIHRSVRKSTTKFQGDHNRPSGVNTRRYSLPQVLTRKRINIVITQGEKKKQIKQSQTVQTDGAQNQYL